MTSTQSLSGITLQTLDNYRAAATLTVAAYRFGSHRLVGLVNGALQDRVYPRTARLAPRATDRMDEVRGSVSHLVADGIDRVADTTEKAIEASSATAAAQVTKVAEMAAGVANETMANSLQAAARLTMPGAFRRASSAAPPCPRRPRRGACSTRRLASSSLQRSSASRTSGTIFSSSVF